MGAARASAERSSRAYTTSNVPRITTAASIVGKRMFRSPAARARPPPAFAARATFLLDEAFPIAKRRYRAAYDLRWETKVSELKRCQTPRRQYSRSDDRRDDPGDGARRSRRPHLPDQCDRRRTRRDESSPRRRQIGRAAGRERVCQEV